MTIQQLEAARQENRRGQQRLRRQFKREFGYDPERVSPSSAVWKQPEMVAYNARSHEIFDRWVNSVREFLGWTV